MKHYFIGVIYCQPCAPFSIWTQPHPLLSGPPITETRENGVICTNQ